MSSIKAFVTGPTGFVGINLVIDLLKSEIFSELVLFVYIKENPKRLDQLKTEINLNNKSNIKVRLVHGDVVEKENLLDNIPQNCDVVFHSAGYVDVHNKEVDLQNSVNITGTKNVVDVCLAKGVKKLIYLSSVSVYGDENHKKKKGIIFVNEKTEKSGYKSKLNYAVSKYYAEREVIKGNKKGLFTVILQPSPIFGIYGEKEGITDFLKSVFHGKIPSTTSGETGWLDVKDCSKTIVNAYLNGKKGEEYIIGGVNCSYHYIINLMQKILGKEELYPGSYWFLYFISCFCELYWFSFRKKEIPPINREAVALLYRKINFISSKAIKELIYKPTSLEVSLKRWLEWYENGRNVETRKNKKKGNIIAKGIGVSVVVGASIFLGWYFLKSKK